LIIFAKLQKNVGHMNVNWKKLSIFAFDIINSKEFTKSKKV